jgi:hypothetical protein
MIRDYRELRLQQIQQSKRIALTVILASLSFAVGFIGVAVISSGAVLSLQAALFLAAGLGIVVLYAQISLRDLDIEEQWLRRQP